MTECNTSTRLLFQSKFRVDIEFNAADLTTDGGAVLLRQIDDQLGLCKLIADLVPDDRDPAKVVHSRFVSVNSRLGSVTPMPTTPPGFELTPC